VKLETDSDAPADKATEFKFMSQPDVPTEPSAITVVPLLSVHRKNDAVPVVPMVTEEIAAAVITPAEAENALDDGSAIAASKVLPLSAVSGVEGCVPE
jgi:hypothetical protein